MTQSLRASLEILFEPWIGAADDDQAVLKFAKLDPNDKSSVIAVVRTDLLPHFSALPTVEREAISCALSGTQSLGSHELERFWESMLPPFSLPERHHHFFNWVSEALTP